ncbi:MAG TPA: site-specific DNA-methyltransferase, partial [Rhodospirillales bacterium]|nr:site-specific DNA-methyltransferase [Rhodospirillales bacterium]
EYAGKVKCVFIDPPYNTGSAFEHYDDGLEHSLWLSLMRDRLEIIRHLLSDDGSLWITIDDNEAHYLKVMCDEIFGRAAFIANIVWQKRTSRENRAAIGSAHDHVFVYSPAGPQRWRDVRNRLEDEGKYSNQDNDPRGPWRSIPFSAQGFRANQMYDIVTPSGVVLKPPSGRCWGATEPVFNKYLAKGRVYFPKKGAGRPRIKQYKGEEAGLAPMTWWDASFAGDNQAAKKEIINLFGDDIFGTPKPEKLLMNVIHIATNPGDLVLDSFAGSGTTGAVAHKMGRRWIMVELGEHCHTHIIPRLQKVIDGEDKGGITEAVGWQGGGGFRYFHLAPSLLEKDKWGREVISKKFNAAMLAEAVCKLEGFAYAPSDTVYWRHGHSTEQDFIYVTTQTMGPNQLQQLSDEVGSDRSLLVLCAAFRGSADQWPNLTIKKIPNHVRSRCEWGRDDYSLKIENLPKAPAKPGQQDMFGDNKGGRQ